MIRAHTSRKKKKKKNQCPPKLALKGKRKGGQRGLGKKTNQD